jgi:hypothetical protein
MSQKLSKPIREIGQSGATISTIRFMDLALYGSLKFRTIYDHLSTNLP